MATIQISEYSASVNTPQMVKASILSGGHPIIKNGRMIKYSGGFCVVFPFETPSNKYAVRCWHTSVNGIYHRTKEISNALKTAKLPYFVRFEYVPKGLMTTQGLQDIVVMDWVNGKSLKHYIGENIYQPYKLKDLAEKFKAMVADLHKVCFAHGDLQHGNILCKDDGNIILVDYDSMYVPSLEGESDDIKGLDGYQHPARRKTKLLSPKIDYFSELIIYTSIIALAKFPDLWTTYKLEDTETMLFTAEDLTSGGDSPVFSYIERDSELKILSEAIKSALQKDDIEDILPLEEYIIDPKDIVVKEIASKWNDNGHKPECVNIEEFVRRISNRW